MGQQARAQGLRGRGQGGEPEPSPDARIRLDGDRPIHGVAPSFLHWELVGAPEASSVKAKLSWTSPDLLEVFPFTHELEIEAIVGDGLLTMETTLFATGSDPRSRGVRISPVPADPGH